MVSDEELVKHRAKFEEVQKTHGPYSAASIHAADALELLDLIDQVKKDNQAVLQQLDRVKSSNKALDAVLMEIIENKTNERQ